MADKRIDQLTEAEDINDEDLFVIWKENISQTRSIAKGTMNLASKSYVESLVASRTPDWSNAVAITSTQLQAGYTAPADGVIVGNGAGTSAVTLLSVNDVVCAVATYSGGMYVRMNTFVMVQSNDIIKTSANLNTVCQINFVPYKTLN